MSLRRQILIMLTICIGMMAANAKSVWTDSVLCVAGKDVCDADIHVLCKAPAWNLKWDVIDDANFSMLRIKRCSADFNDEIYDNISELTLIRTSHGHEEILGKEKVPHKTLMLGVRVIKTDNNVIIRGGDGRNMFNNCRRLTFMATEGSECSIHIPGKHPFKIIRRRLWQREPGTIIPFNTIDSLNNYLATSNDTIEGIWEYMDRDMPELGVTLGGFYRIATVKTGDHYTIALINNAKAYADIWKPLQTKGRLLPTIFKNHFDLEWITSNRKDTISQETYAFIDENNAVLTLKFPLLNTQIRFRRCIMDKNAPK